MRTIDEPNILQIHRFGDGVEPFTPTFFCNPNYIKFINNMKDYNYFRDNNRFNLSI